MKFSQVFALAIIIVMLLGCLSQWNDGLGEIWTPTADASQPLQLAPASSNPINESTYGVGLSGAPVILDEPTLRSMTGGPMTVQSFETVIQEYFVPMAVRLVFVDIGWGNYANTSSTLVAGGFEPWFANWLQATYAQGIDNIIFTKQFGYYFSSPSWDQDVLNAYPGTATSNSNGQNVPLTSCAGCTTSSGWTITSPVIYRQYEQDLKQLFTWYGNYTNWVGFGEGATGDRNEYIDPGTALKTSRPWDNGTIYAFANSMFFQRSINSSGYYLGTNTLSEIWSMFLEDRPDIAESTGVPLVYPTLLGGSCVSGGCSIYKGNVMLERFYVPQTVAGFKISAYMESVGSPTTSLYETIYPDNTSIAMKGAPVRDEPIVNVSVSGVTSTAGWVSTTISSATLIGGDYYWVGFTFNGPSASSSNYYAVDSDQQNVFTDIQIWTGSGGISSATGSNGGSVLWVQSLAGSNIAIYPYLMQGPNQNGGAVNFQVSNAVQVNTISFMYSDHSYDPNNLTISLEFASNSSVITTGTYSIVAQRGMSTISELPIQLAKIVTLYPSFTYQIVEQNPPSGDNYAGSSGGGVTQDLITETANPTSAGYLGQTTWPPMQLGLMQLEPNGVSNYDYLGTTDLQYSPGENGNNQVALRFQVATPGTLQEFEVEVIQAAWSSNVLNVTLRPDNVTCPSGISGTCSHPTKRVSSLAYGTVSFSSVNSTFHSCSGAFGGVCAWANVTFAGSTSLAAGTYYWLVMNTTGNQYMGLERLVTPYRDLVYVSSNDFQTKWGPPNDGPTDISFQIITSGGDISNAVQGDVHLSLGIVAQSFESSTNFQLKGLWVPTSIGAPAVINVTVRADSGSDSPSSTILAQGLIQENTPGNSLNYVSLNIPINITGGTKYWFTMTFQCQVSHCSSSPQTIAVVYRSDSENQAYGGGALHYETFSSSSWVSPIQEGSIVFVLAGSDSIIKTYKTSTLYNEVASHEDTSSSYAPIGQWNTFLDYTESQMMYNLTRCMSAYFGRQLLWYTGMPASITSVIPDVDYQNILTASAGAGGPIGCPPSQSTCGGTSTFWPNDAQDKVQGILSSPNQNIAYPWSSFGFTLDNRGDLTPTDLRTEYVSNLAMYATNILTFNDWSWGTNYHGINNATQTQYATAFGSILSRMEYNGGYFGTNKDAVRALWIGGSSDGVVPEFLTPAINITYVSSSYSDINNLTEYGNLNQFNVVLGMPSSPTSSFMQRLTNFVKNGGGYVDIGFDVNTTPSILGMSLSSTSISPTSLTITSASAITNPYTSINYQPYYATHLAKPLSNETAVIFVVDQSGDPMIWANNYYGGIGVELPSPATSRLTTGVGNPPVFDGQQYGAPRDAWISLLINAIFYAAHQQSRLPIIWDNSYGSNGVQNWSPHLQFSIDGSPGKPLLLWLSSNDSFSSSFSINLNAAFYGISTEGWIAINVQNMQVVARGTGSDVVISTTLPAYSWAPIYITNDTSSSNLQALYSTGSILSTSVSGSSASLSIGSPLNSSSWLVLTSTSPINSISSSITGSIPSYSSLVSLNQTQVGYYCTSVSSGACSSWAARSQEGYYYDSTNNLLYIHYRGGSSMTLSLSSSASWTSSSSTTTTTVTTTKQISSATSTTSSSTATTTSSTAQTTLATSSSTSSLGSVSIKASPGPYAAGTPITFSGDTYNQGGPPGSQTIYVWINGVNQGPVTSSSSGHWIFSFTPSSNRMYYISASQNPDGSGITSQQLQLMVASASTSTSVSLTTTTTTVASALTTSTSQITVTTSTSNGFTSSTKTTGTASSSKTTSQTSSIMTASDTTGQSTSRANSSSSSSATTESSSQPNNSGELFGFVPFLASSTQTPLGTAILACVVGSITAAPFVIRKIAKKVKEEDMEESHGWRW